MPPREKEFDAVVLVVDVGLTASASGFLDTALHCASELLQRKLFSESLDRFGLVEVGSDRSHNDLDYEHISVLDRGLTVADWELLEYVQKHVKGTSHESDWLDGVVVAMDWLKKQTDGTKCSTKKIVLLSDLGVPSSEDKLDLIVRGMESQGIEFVFIGPDWGENKDEDVKKEAPDNPENGSSSNSAPLKKPKTPAQLASEAMVGQLVQATGEGLMCTIQDAMASLMFRERRKKRPFPWKATLEIGSDIRINTVGYIQIRREAPKTWKKTLAKKGKGSAGSAEELKPETTFVRNNEDEDTLEQSDLIESYKYGSDAVPVTEEDKANFKYSGGAKNLAVLGFVKRAEVPRQLATGDGCMVFQPVEADDASSTALSALAHALYELGMCALVRKVYRANSCPRLGVLAPEYMPDDDGNDQLMPYFEDLRQFTFAPVQNENVKPDREQLQAVDDLIDAMMLGISASGETNLEPESLMNPTYQHLYHCLAARAINPGQVLPEVPEYIRGLMQPPEAVANAAAQAMKRLGELFHMEEIARKKAKVTGAEAYSDSRIKREAEEDSNKKTDNADDLSLSRKAAVTEVGSATPVEDFKQLLQDGEALISVGQQLERVIFDLLEKSFGGGLFEKIVACLREYRMACFVRNNPHLYNDFMNELRHEIARLRRGEIWLDIVEANLCLFTNAEHLESKISEEAAKDFINSVTKAEAEPATKAPSEPVKDDEDDDMLDDL